MATNMATGVNQTSQSAIAEALNTLAGALMNQSASPTGTSSSQAPVQRVQLNQVVSGSG